MSTDNNSDRLIGMLFTLVLATFSTLFAALWNIEKAAFYKAQSQELRQELLELQHEYEGYEKAANQLK